MPTACVHHGQRSIRSHDIDQREGLEAPTRKWSYEPGTSYGLFGGRRVGQGGGKRFARLRWLDAASG